MRVIIIGAGPTGLGAAYRLSECGHDDFQVYERNNYVGGLATSFHDEKGFTWDFAIHVAHSHYTYVDELMEKFLPNGFFNHERRSWVREYGAFVPYPFQTNFRHLPEGPRNECLNGLEQLKNAPTPPPDPASPQSFENWILSNFGEGIAKHFMLPYNRKIWATDPADMGVQWLGDRVPVVDVERVRQNIVEGRDEVSWGPNATFQFPKEGGTGAIWNAMASHIPADRIQLSTDIVEIDPVKKTVTLADGTEDHYDHLISTIPIPTLARITKQTALAEEAKALRYTHVYVICVAPNFPLPANLTDKTWVYCPEDAAPFYRVTPFSILSPDHVPDRDKQCSFMCEISSPGTEPYVDAEQFVQPTIQGLREIGLVDCDASDTHVYPLKTEFGYPVPTIDRDEVLSRIIPPFEEMGIFSRGRFGGWKYEAANMDHSIMQGVEAVDRILEGKPEITWAQPNLVNAGKR